MLNVAIKAARAAGSIINRASLDLDILKIEAKSPHDFVTEVDQRAEQVIIDTLLAAYPGHGILAEESGSNRGAAHSDFVWIIDPLDGTTNFIHGLPVYCVSIALAFKGKVEQAVVYDPTRNDLFMASRGRGAFLNDKRIRVSKRIRMADALIGTGFPFRRGDNFQRYLKILETLMPECAGLRRPGAAALDLCYVAAGYYDAFFEIGLSPWDMAAGSLIVTEAGGLVGNFTGEADFLFQREIIAGAPKIYGQLVHLLKDYTGIQVEAAGSPSTETSLAAPDATDTFTALAGVAETAPVPRKPLRLPRKAAAAPKPSDSDDAPF
jgi:myo-inositol-1(or 4)-monophosphatase